LRNSEAASDKVSEFSNNKGHKTDPNKRSPESSPTIAILWRRNCSKSELPSHTCEVEEGFFSINSVNFFTSIIKTGSKNESSFELRSP
jgi:hypothetical protein